MLRSGTKNNTCFNLLYLTHDNKLFIKFLIHLQKLKVSSPLVCQFAQGKWAIFLKLCSLYTFMVVRCSSHKQRKSSSLSL